MLLLDTDVVSLLRRQDRHPKMAMGLKTRRPSHLYLSVVTLAELESGIVKKQHHDPTFSQELTNWLEQLLDSYANRILPVNARVARRWGQLSGALGYESKDLLIAATALEHGLVVVTRNIRHLQHPDGTVLDPLADTSALTNETNNE